MKKRRLSRKLNFKEGTWFAVPLPSGGFGIGRVARLTPKGEIILAYCYGPKREQVPPLDEIDHLEPNEAIKVFKIGGYGLIDGTWPVIGDSPRWEREKWPIPDFIRRDPLSRKAWRVIYSDENPNRVLFEERIAYDTTGLRPNRLSGHIAAEHHLEQRLKE